MKSLSKNLTAQMYSQAVTFTVQLGMVPVLIGFWGVEAFGVWALLTAIPTYLSFSDFGFTFIAKNDMAMSVAAGNREYALETFQSILLLLTFLIGGLAITLGSAVLLLPLDRVFEFGEESLATVRAVLLLQITAALLYQLFLLLSAGVRCEGRAALETVFGASGRLFEALLIVISALAGGGLVLAAVAVLVARLATLGFVIGWLYRTTPWLRLGFSAARTQRLKQLFWPSVNYMAVPLSNALLIQAPVVILGAVATPAAVALYTVSRTVARMGMSVANMVSYAFTPEYSFAWGRRDEGGFRRMMRLQTFVIAAIAATYLAAAWWVLPWGVSLLSHNQIAPHEALSMALAIGVMLEMLWTAGFAPLSAVNRHREVARAFLVFASGAIAASVTLTSPSDMAAAVAAAQFATLGVALWRLGGLDKALTEHIRGGTS